MSAKTRPAISVREFFAQQAEWQAYLTHLSAVNMLHSATHHGEPKENCFYLGVVLDDAVIGHISIRKQALVVPSSTLNAHHEVMLRGADGTGLHEAFVMSFAVEVAQRRLGYGRALQEAAVEKARALGCYQMRSWSSADRTENYALKLSMGFAVVPALYPVPGGTPISGVYFVKRIAPQP